MPGCRPRASHSCADHRSGLCRRRRSCGRPQAAPSRRSTPPSAKNTGALPQSGQDRSDWRSQAFLRIISSARRRRGTRPAGPAPIAQDFGTFPARQEKMRRTKKNDPGGISAGSFFVLMRPFGPDGSRDPGLAQTSTRLRPRVSSSTSSISRLLCRIEDQSERPMRPAPPRPVMTSGMWISVWKYMTTERIRIA